MTATDLTETASDSPSWDERAEQAVLGGIMRSGSARDQAAGLVSVDFYRPSHQIIHAAVQRLEHRGAAIDPITVLDELMRAGDVRQGVIDGPYLHTCQAACPVPGEIAPYVEIVLAHARRRDMRDRLASLTQLHTHDLTDEALLTRMRGEVKALANLIDGVTVTNGRTLHAVTAADRPMRAARWLMSWRIPMGAITLLTGREGIGKSTTSYDIIARITHGTLDGAHHGTPRSVGIVATEDAWEEVIIPRLHAAGADTARVHEIQARTSEGYGTTLSVPGDLERLTTLVATHDIALIVLDPLMSVIPGGVDTHKDREVRSILEPLAHFCATTGTAVLGLIHVNKSNGHDPLNSIMASKAFTAVARSVLYCIVDPDDEHEDRFLLGHPKSNLGPKQPSLAYRITPVTIERDDHDPIHTSRVVWLGEDQRTIATVMEPRRPQRPNGELVERILDYIRGQIGVVTAKQVCDELDDVKDGTVRKTLTRMTDRGQLTQPVRGSYTLPPEIVTPRCDTSLETS